jgi:hypothetical protein
LPKIYVYLWFDIEDYVTKESNDLPLTALKILKKYNVPVTCKLVAEKIRFLQQNNRSDVLAAIAEQDVGYHLDTHSRHPTLYEYLSELDVRSGAKEFYTREIQGLELVKQVFNRSPSCFGHPGPIWAPHVYPALTAMQIPIYLDETSILSLHDQPYWYCGVLNLNGANRNFIVIDYSFQNPNGAVILKQRFRRTHRKLRHTGGAISILFHLHTTINKQFWDVVNFKRGKNRSIEECERPPAQPLKITRRAWEQFEELIRYISSNPDVEFITATQAARMYGRTIETETAVGRDELREISRHYRTSCDYFESVEGRVLSPSQGFYAIAKALSGLTDGTVIPAKIEFKEPLGPMAVSKTIGIRKVSSADFLASAKAAVEFMDEENCLPSALRVGDSTSLSPEDFLTTASKLLGDLLIGNHLPSKIILTRGKAPNSRYLNPADFRKACRWAVLPPNFKAPKILEQIQLQAWTLRPALLSQN